jgi:Ca2+-binding RTX toxin-like protein
MDHVIWVSATASRGGDGSKASPFDTIQEAIDAAVPGTVIKVGEGYYKENLEFSNSGTEGNPISLVSSDGPGAATIAPAVSGQDTIQIDGTDHITIDGFELHGSNDASRQVIHIHAVDGNTNPASHIVISNNTIIRGAGDGIKVSKSTDITLLGNSVEGGGSQESGIDLVGVERALIQGNSISEIGHIGVMVKGGSSDIMIVENSITGSGHNAIEVGGYTNLNSYPPGFLEAGLTYEARNVLVHGNIISDSGNSAIRLIGAVDVLVSENMFNGAGTKIKIDDSAKFHETWFSERLGFLNNQFDLDDWLVDRSDLSSILTGPEASDLFTPWLTGTGSDSDESAGPGTATSPDPDPELVSEIDVETEEEFQNVTQGTSSKDRLSGTSENDVIIGLGGDDRLSGLNGNDRLDGGDGRDKIEGGDGADTLFGGAGNDDVRGGRDDDLIFGMDGRDKLRGGDGNDIMYGGEGNDKLDGESGDDVLFGGAGKDKLVGGDGDDLLEGGNGDDRLEGGSGADSFVFRFGTEIGADRIEDFERGEDKLVLLDFGGEMDAFSDLDTNGDGFLNDSDAHTQVSGRNTYIDLSSVLAASDGTHVIRIEDNNLSIEDFVFSF